MQLTPFADIHALAETRKGGKAALAELLAGPKPLGPKKLAAIPDDRYLSMMARCVLQAGFTWKVVENMWPAIEEAFHGFHPKGLAHLAPEKWDAYLDDRRVVRNHVKIRAILANAHFVWNTAEAHGSFGTAFAAWPASDQIGLMHWLKKEGSRLGTNTAMYFIRFIGKDGFLLSSDVVARLRASGVAIRENPTSNKDLALVQQAFNQWHAETGLPYTKLSRIAGLSIGTNPPPM